jgi:hypothetical protein
MATETTDDEVAALEFAKTEEIPKTERAPALIWDDQACGLCVRVYEDSSKAFIFVYRINNRQRFIRIGKTPVWSLDAARKRAKKLRTVVDQGLDPATNKPEPDKVGPVENIIEYIAGHLRAEN